MGAWHRDPVPRASVRLITWGMIWPMLTFFLIGLPGLPNPGFQHAGTMAPPRGVARRAPHGRDDPHHALHLGRTGALSGSGPGGGERRPGSGAGSRWGRSVACPTPGYCVCGWAPCYARLRSSAWPYIFVALGSLVIALIVGSPSAWILAFLMPFVLSPITLSLNFIAGLAQVRRESPTGAQVSPRGATIFVGACTVVSWSAAIYFAVVDYAALHSPGWEIVR